jgi:hypothetical protein
MKKSIALVFVLALGIAPVFADDIAFLTQKVAKVSDDLGLRLAITSTFRTYDQQIDAMRGKSQTTLTKWYGADTAQAFAEFENGARSRNSLLKDLQDNVLIKHPKGLAVDIGVNSSGLSPAQKDRVVAALKAEGLYVLDEVVDGNPCIHVSRSMR